MKRKEIKAWMLLNRRSGELVLEGGISKDRKVIEPNPIYRKEFKEVPVKIIYEDKKAS